MSTEMNVLPGAMDSKCNFIAQTLQRQLGVVAGDQVKGATDIAMNFKVPNRQKSAKITVWELALVEDMNAGCSLLPGCSETRLIQAATTRSINMEAS
jgi:hypothetical protein